MPKNVGLRFQRSEAPKLRHIAIRVRLAELGKGKRTDLYDKAAASAETGEPLIVRCEDPVEAVQMAEAFVVLGIKRPAVEALSG